MSETKFHTHTKPQANIVVFYDLVFTLLENTKGKFLDFKTARVTRIQSPHNYVLHLYYLDRLCGLVVRVLGYRSGGPGTTPPPPKVVGLERSPLSPVSKTEELLERKAAAPV
jgi:hypothetical protein